MSAVGSTSAPVANCGVWGFLEASGSYKFNYKYGRPSLIAPRTDPRNENRERDAKRGAEESTGFLKPIPTGAFGQFLRDVPVA
jgi:hypothetical protein